MRIFLILFLLSINCFAKDQEQRVALSVMNAVEQKIYISDAQNKIESEYEQELNSLLRYIDKKQQNCTKSIAEDACETDLLLKKELLSKKKLKEIFDKRLEKKLKYFSENDDWKYSIKDNDLFFWFPILEGSKVVIHDVSLFRGRETFSLLRSNRKNYYLYDVLCIRNIEMHLANCELTSFSAVKLFGAMFKVIGETKLELGQLLASQREMMTKPHAESDYVVKTESGEIEFVDGDWVIRYQIDICNPMEVYKFDTSTGTFILSEFILGRAYCG